MAQAESTIPRRTLFAALLTAPIAVAPVKPAAIPALRPGNIWVQVPEEAWGQLLETARALENFGRR